MEKLKVDINVILIEFYQYLCKNNYFADDTLSEEYIIDRVNEYCVFLKNQTEMRCDCKNPAFVDNVCVKCGGLLFC